MDLLHHHSSPSVVPVRATVVLVKASVLDIARVGASVVDRIEDALGRGVSLHLVSSSVVDAGGKGKVGKAAALEGWSSSPLQAKVEDLSFHASLEWEGELGIPGAVVVKNHHHSEFYLRSITLEGVPGAKNRLHLVCNSWVYPVASYSYDRIFFLNDSYTYERTPEALRKYRQEELGHLRGDGFAGELKKWHRVYDYAYYNDLGNPDKGPEYARPVLGGSEDYPYPRRGRTGRPPSKSDPKTESRLPVLKTLDVYVPRDEVFDPVKLSDLLATNIKLLGEALLPVLKSLVDGSPHEFDSLEDILSLYEGGLNVDNAVLAKIRDLVPFEILKELLRSDGQQLLKLPLPQVIQADKTAWRTDEEFGREMLAGMNPVSISRLTVFPPVSKLDPSKYGNQNSQITAHDIEKNMGGLRVEQALAENKLFILDHHDSLMPYVNRINSTANKIYASRTILFLKDDGTLKPLAIELSLPNPDGESHGFISKVFTPSDHGVEESLWQLAKAYVAVDDSGIQMLISHWLNTHAAIEPFAIATSRQLSVMHPIYKLLHPHYHDTMYINAVARQILVNAGYIIEHTVFPAKYCMELSSAVYKNWKFPDQGLPADLLKRGVAVEDPCAPNKLRLLIEDYPYAVDGLEIWHAIESWVVEYCSIYYAKDSDVQRDSELQAWWKEIREVGHGDMKNETWWPKMDSILDLTKACTTIIWVASALHAAVNFGMYSYAGYAPNRPTISRRLMPEPGTPEYEELETDPEKAFIKTITAQLQSILAISVLEALCTHSTEEIYLGQTVTAEWTSDEKAILAFKRFGEKLVEVEKKIAERNRDPSLKNRNGPVKVPYMLLYPNTSDRSGVGGLTGKGIPNSVSI